MMIKHINHLNIWMVLKQDN